MLTFHHSKTIERQLPAPPHQQVHEKHGTRVTVRNLFGNLPVRVKQRAVVAEHKAEHDRLWEALRREVTGLLLSWGRPASLRIRDVDGRTVLSFFNSNRAADSARPRSDELYFMLNTLTQANYLLVDEWSSWVPAAASTPTISIKGAISLAPAPNKRGQFISLGIRPLSIESGHNELYDEVNRLFSLSSFGSVEEDTGVLEKGKTRLQGDGYTTKQVKARKGVDRYPMFHLRILLKDGNQSSTTEEQIIEDDSSLKTVLGVLDAMITQWLSLHHFRPSKPRTRPHREETPATPVAHVREECQPGSNLQPLHENQSILSAKPTPHSSKSTEPSGRKRKRTKPSGQDPSQGKPQHFPFADWSRIKSAKPDFFDTLGSAGKRGHEGNTRPSNRVGERALDANVQAPGDGAKFDITPVLPGSLDGGLELERNKGDQPASDEGDHDSTVAWTEPLTKETFILNARTGYVLPRAPSGPLGEPSISANKRTLDGFDKPLRIQKKLVSSHPTPTPWLDGVLESWANPVFKPVEKGIQQVYLSDNRPGEHNCHHGSCHSCSAVRDDQEPQNHLAPGINKLSRIGLQNARILAQVDRKFILVKMQTVKNVSSDSDPETEALVLVDQHAADERVRVEDLFSALCSPLSKDDARAGYQSKLGHRSPVSFTVIEQPIRFIISEQERVHFVTHAATFAAWGFLFNIEPSKSVTVRKQPVLSVIALPSAISERCKADPQLIITLLRAAVWKYVDNPCRVSSIDDTLTHSVGQPDGALWVRRMSSCPDGLIDLINSRACRSAIMFNDKLSLDDCKELVRKLSNCVFPFMCAHGRPSMVPIVELGVVGEETGFGREPGSSGVKTNFVQAWKSWNGE